MDSIPWYKAKVLRGLLAAVVLYVLQLVGIGASDANVEQWVNGILTVFEFLALAYAGWHRVKSPTPPIQGSKLGNENDQSLKAHPLATLLCLFVLAPVLGSSLTGCATLGLTSGQSPEQRAAALLGDFTLYQKASLQIGSDETVLPEVRRKVLDAAIAAKPVADQGDGLLREYRSIKAQFDAGTTTDQKLAIAASHLQSWTQQMLPLITQLRTLIEGVQK